MEIHGLSNPKIEAVNMCKSKTMKTDFLRHFSMIIYKKIKNKTNRLLWMTIEGSRISLWSRFCKLTSTYIFKNTNQPRVKSVCFGSSQYYLFCILCVSRRMCPPLSLTLKNIKNNTYWHMHVQKTLTLFQYSYPSLHKSNKGFVFREIIFFFLDLLWNNKIWMCFTK